jgi:hypothetical protein
MVVRGASDKSLLGRSEIVAHLVNEHMHLSGTDAAEHEGEKKTSEGFQFQEDTPLAAIPRNENLV